MDDTEHMGHPSGSMGMSFTNSHTAMLFSSAWTPSSPQAYAGTCIFLIILAIVDRGLIALKAVLERHWLDTHLNHRYVAIANKPTESGRINDDPDAKLATLITAQGVEESVKVVHTIPRGPIPWRFSIDLPRAALFLCIVGVSYLLCVSSHSFTKPRALTDPFLLFCSMLAAMTMNVGYFCSILAGAFLGELGVGRYSNHWSEHTH
ncbi:hypothetical protein N7512_004567 [Penicillium capsulatum]|nr:hypothetical protein N7512_004567 [Penicillium capsulatum]